MTGVFAVFEKTAFNATAFQSGEEVALAASEAADGFAATSSVFWGVTFGVTEPTDTATFNSTASWGVTFGVTEPADTAVMNTSVYLTAYLDANEAIASAAPTPARLVLAARSKLSSGTAATHLRALSPTGSAAYQVLLNASPIESGTTAEVLVGIEYSLLDTAAVSLSAWHSVAMHAVEAQDLFSADIFSALPVYLEVTEAHDIAAFSSERTFLLEADTGSYAYTGYGAILGYSRVILTQSGSYTINGHAARLYDSSFFYNDVEVICVAEELRSLSLNCEDRLIQVPVGYPVEELAEDRESAAEARMRPT